jgi:hypothetical protein
MTSLLIGIGSAIFMLIILGVAGVGISNVGKGKR